MAVSSKQAEQLHQEALAEQGRLRGELKAMQSSATASYRLESASNQSIGVDADTAIRLNDAKNEAKVRQLTHKVDFLKSQLSAEQQVSYPKYLS